MKATLQTITSKGHLTFKKPTPIMYEIGPKKNECFNFWELEKDGEIKCFCLTSTVLSVTKQDSIWRIKTKQATYELKKAK